jgi:hypothetical protein
MGASTTWYVAAVGLKLGVYNINKRTEATTAAGEKGIPVLFRVATKSQANALFVQLHGEGRVRKLDQHGNLL